MKNNIREIITQAIIAKGKKRTINKYSFNISKYDKVLGCWICNHCCKGSMNEGSKVIGSFDVHIWYCLDNDSYLYKENISYVNDIELVKKEERSIDDFDDLLVNEESQPRCIGVEKNDECVILEIEKEVSLSVVGTTTMMVESKDEEDLEINDNFISK